MSLLSVYEKLKPKPPELLNNPARVLVREGMMQLWSDVDKCARPPCCCWVAAWQKKTLRLSSFTCNGWRPRQRH
jgi:hypothetical protein